MYLKNRMCQIKNLNDIYMQKFGYRDNGFFVDIGAFDGVQWSNTHNLALAGWAGIAVEPNPEYYKQLEAVYKDNKKVVTHNLAIANFTGVTDLYIGGSLTTIKPKTIDIYNSTNWGKFSGLKEDNKIETKVTTLDNIVFNAPIGFEVLSIDVEGAEIDVLKGFSIDFFRPELIIIESHEENEDRRLARKSRYINAYMCKYGYRKLQSDSINTVYERAN